MREESTDKGREKRIKEWERIVGPCALAVPHNSPQQNSLPVANIQQLLLG